MSPTTMPPSGGFFCAFCDQSKLALGWRKKKLSVKVFSTTGAVLLFCKQAAARRGKSYKTSDRSELAMACKAELMSQKRKKKLSVKVFSTTGAVLLFCKQAAARRGKSYKTSDRSELATACKAELMSQTRCRWFESVCPDHYAAFGRFFLCLYCSRIFRPAENLSEKSAFIDGNSFPDERKQSVAVKNSS